MSNLEILGQKLKKEEGGLSVVEPQPEVEGGVQVTGEVENLTKMLAMERAWVENTEWEVTFLLGLMEKSLKDGVQTKAK